MTIIKINGRKILDEILRKDTSVPILLMDGAENYQYIASLLADCRLQDKNGFEELEQLLRRELCMNKTNTKIMWDSIYTPLNSNIQ